MSHTYHPSSPSKPTQYGLRGDPFFWSYLERHFSAIEFPYSEKQLIEDIYNLFNQVSGETLTTEARPYVNEFAHGGMSYGCLYVSDNLSTPPKLLCNAI